MARKGLFDKLLEAIDDTKNDDASKEGVSIYDLLKKGLTEVAGELDKDDTETANRKINRKIDEVKHRNKENKTEVDAPESLFEKLKKNLQKKVEENKNESLPEQENEHREIDFKEIKEKEEDLACQYNEIEEQRMEVQRERSRLEAERQEIRREREKMRRTQGKSNNGNIEHKKNKFREKLNKKYNKHRQQLEERYRKDQERLEKNFQRDMERINRGRFYDND